jgi:hypothetical protein
MEFIHFSPFHLLYPGSVAQMIANPAQVEGDNELA